MKKASISPNPVAYGGTPSALERTQSTDRQIRWDENTIIWGDRDDLPMRIMDAVNSSPTTTSCLSTRENFIAGSGFEDEELMKMPVDKDGTTFWEFHLQLVPYMALLESFAVNFKFDRKGRISNSYAVGAETCRFVKPQGKKIFSIKQNPYFGTQEYKAELTTEYPVFDMSTIKEVVNIADDNFPGQIYFFGTVRPPYKFYAVPKYWSGEKWIYVDAGIQQFHKENMDNGFFQSTLINVIGDPNQKTKNPKYAKEITQTDGTKKKVFETTIAEEFNDQMAKTFSGARKAGTAMVLWSLNKDQAVNVQAFPVNSQFDVLAGTYQDAIRGICTATEIDPILLTVQNNGLSNAGDSVKAIIEYTQSKVKRQQTILENFYNTIMLPNLQTKTEARVKLRNYVPITTSVTVEDKFWDVLSDAEKKEFVKMNVAGMATAIKEPQVVVDDETGEPLTPTETQLNESISKLSGLDIIRMQAIARKYDKGEITLEQAKLLLKAKGLTDVDVNTWLGITEEAVQE